MKKIPSWHITLDQGILLAEIDASHSGLPQTVFQNSDTCGWANTNPFSSTLEKSQVFVTMLPKRYFVH